eukprot:TRINITY_DN5156_c0_g1_i2.p1 TRINITY_DN5156_c0_g1~~TRINITY_DN5156_c0_g1_i2.p1  ORF type:complete len:1017 (+),score=254.13 TRINITY_DN5156_c0_g1_i2:291-3341(+)
MLNFDYGMDNGKKFEVKECVRMTSVGCASEPQANALIFLKSNDLRSFTDIINNADVESNAVNADHWINQPADDAGATLLESAILLQKTKFVEQLVKAGARLDLVSQASGFAPPHLAIEKGDANLLKLVLSDQENSDVNIKSADFKRGISPLHLAAEKSNTECMKILLDFEEIDVDSKDIKGVQTPILFAIKSKNEEAVKLLIENGACLDLKAGRLTIREYLKENFPHLDPTKIRVKKSREVMLNLKDKVFSLLKDTELNQHDYGSKLANFKTYMRFIRNLREENVLDSVFDLACKKGLHEHVELLLRKGVNPNTVTKPVLEAAFFGHHQVLKHLKAYNANFCVSTGSKETILHLVLKMQSDFGSKLNYDKCLEELIDPANPQVFDQIKSIINKKDDRSNTALHYATQKWSQATVRKLLEMGANIGIKNHWDEIPISKIRPETMENFLSEFCLTSDGDVVHENFAITFKYDFLAPNIDSLPDKYQDYNQDSEEKQDLITSNENLPSHALPETEPLWYMSQSKEHRHLLKHPVITSFLWYKWQRIRRYFNRNLRFFSTFVFLLTWYIFRNYGGMANSKAPDLVWYGFFILFSCVMFFFILKDWTAEIKNYQRNQKLKHAGTNQDSSCCLITSLFFSSWIEAIFVVILLLVIVVGSSCLKFVLFGFLILLVLREGFEMLVSMKRYLSSFENWIEVAIVILASTILLTEGANFELNRHLAAISIVLSWAELIVLIGRHPKLKEYNIYVTMFLKVLKTFIFFFTWYSLFIIAFGLGFFILLHNDVSNPNAINGTESSEEYVFFNKAWLSLVKTTTMFVGELEFSDIPINLDSDLAPVAYAFFLSFVFLIVVVLMNLLNGLAVSDTGLIREKAEIFSYRSQVETISTFESMLLGDPFDFLSNVPAMLSNLPSCSLLRQLYRNRTLKKLFNTLGATEILLFYKFLPNKCITIHPNQRGNDCACLRVDEIGRSIVAAAKEIVIKQQRVELKSEENVGEKVDALQAQVDRLETNIDLILKKLNKI